MPYYNVSDAYFRTLKEQVVGVYLHTYRVLKMNPASSSQQVPDSNILCVISKTEVLSFFLQNPHICSTQVQRQFLYVYGSVLVYMTTTTVARLQPIHKISLTLEKYIRKLVVNYLHTISQTQVFSFSKVAGLVVFFK